MSEMLKSRSDVDAKRMQPTRVVHYASTDGLDIPAYLTLPGKPDRPAPLIVLVHGGAFARDHWGWSEDVQVFAAHGYAVLQPQFRGSTGFGSRFEQAGYQQFGHLMQDDVSAGVRDLVARKVVDPERVCIVGTQLWRLRGAVGPGVDARALPMRRRHLGPVGHRGPGHERVGRRPLA